MKFANLVHNISWFVHGVFFSLHFVSMYRQSQEKLENKQTKVKLHYMILLETLDTMNYNGSIPWFTCHMLYWTMIEFISRFGDLLFVSTLLSIIPLAHHCPTFLPPSFLPTSPPPPLLSLSLPLLQGPTSFLGMPCICFSSFSLHIILKLIVNKTNNRVISMNIDFFPPYPCSNLNGDKIL